MNPYMTGEELRRWAAKCLQEACTAESEYERKWLQSMGDGLLELAATQDWLEGRNSNAPSNRRSPEDSLRAEVLRGYKRRSPLRRTDR